ncbi:organic solute transporter Ostalpha-domain-containing protein [Trichophaea hybrida]|nr:organic solute transporter Ostalpha-domain-containing protein [Trichophaea hybrida]
MDYHISLSAQEHRGSGTSKLSTIAIVLSGVASLIATLLSFLSIWFQLKNYRKPLLQRYVVRILLMVPIYAISSWVSLMSLAAAQFLDPIRDMYEAFTIYTFFQLLINFLGGERSLIIMMHGRAPKEHVWPLNYIFPKVDISDPHTFLAVKRGILQYAWLKPPLALAAIIMKATNTYQEGYVGLKSGYFWSGIIYNISVSVSLYSLGIFWVCMARDLQPFRPVPKFLCIKLIIFASYWQGFFLSILVWLGVIHDVGYYTPDNIARAVQDVLICFELPGFSIAHWYAFSWRDYADSTISAARLPVYYAFRDASGIRDLIEDSKQTFKGKSYQYRLFDSSEGVMSHPESNARVGRMMEGLRYERGGKGKYWIPQPTARTGLLRGPGPSNADRQIPAGNAESGENRAWKGGDYGAFDETDLNDEDEKLYNSARSLEFGDYNYPVITADRPYTNHRCGYHQLGQDNLTTTATNQALLRPTPQFVRKGKSKRSSPADSQRKKVKSEAIQPLLHRNESSSSGSSHRSGLIDLVVEDRRAEETARVRARKEGGPGWNEAEPKRYVRQYPPEVAGEEIREGFEPPTTPPVDAPQSPHATQGDPANSRFSIGNEEDNMSDLPGDHGDGSPWRSDDEDASDDGGEGVGEDSSRDISGIYGSMNERNVWGGH